MNQSINQIKDSIQAGQPIVQIISYEEKRVEGFLKKLCQQMLKNQNVFSWDAHNGLNGSEGKIANGKDPAVALDAALKITEPAFFVFKDLNSLLRSSPEIVRKLRECYLQFKGNKKFLFLLSADDFLPPMLKKEIDIITFELPDFEELESLCLKFLESLEKAGVQIQLSTEEKRSFAIAVQGLTIDEAYKAYMKAFQGQGRIHIGLIEKIHQEKKQLILKENVLEFFTHTLTLNDMGGLDKLKDWLMKRKKAFSKEAREFGLDKPKGVLTMGITGCGKSLASKIIATLWNLPLFRLDMNLVYSGNRRTAGGRFRPGAENHGFGVTGHTLDRRDRKRHQRQAHRQRVLAHPGIFFDLDAGAYVGNLHRRHRQPHRPAAARAAASRPFRPDFLH